MNDPRDYLPALCPSHVPCIPRNDTGQGNPPHEERSRFSGARGASDGVLVGFVLTGGRAMIKTVKYTRGYRFWISKKQISLCSAVVESYFDIPSNVNTIWFVASDEPMRDSYRVIFNGGSWIEIVLSNGGHAREPGGWRLSRAIGNFGYRPFYLRVEYKE